MGFILHAIKDMAQIYCWGLCISLAFFILVMIIRGVGSEGYPTHIAACVGLAVIWPFSCYEIIHRILNG